MPLSLYLFLSGLAVLALLMLAVLFHVGTDEPDEGEPPMGVGS